MIEEASRGVLLGKDTFTHGRLGAATVEAALSFDVPDDPERVELQQLLRTLTAAEATERITGLQPADPLYADVLAVVAGRAGGGS